MTLVKVNNPIAKNFDGLMNQFLNDFPSAVGKTDIKWDFDLRLIRKEFSNKSFKRSFTLDEKIDGANIVAKYENGILNVEIPKKELEKTAAKEITIL